MTSTRNAGVREQAVWALFADWCAALNYPELPAESAVLAQFLAAHPATASTQRRRIAVINAAHRRTGHPEPGHAETIRGLVDSRRALAMKRRAAAVATAIGALPEQGWPAATFARRDALMLVLAAAGMPASYIADLRIGQLEAHPQTDVVIVSAKGEVFSTPGELLEHGVSPLAVRRGWLRVRAIEHHLASTRWVAAHLRGDPVPAVAAAPADLPLLTPIDRWGATPLKPTPLSAASVARIIRAHLDGSAKPHQQIAAVTTAALNEDDRDNADSEDCLDATPLDPGTFTRGVDARRQAARELNDVTAVLDDIDDRADQLLADLLRLLEHPDKGR